MSDTAWGLSIVLAAGVIGSATLLPMKFVKQWPWEQSWLIYAANAYLILPLAVAWWTIPQLPAVYGAVSARTLIQVALLGLGWGLSVVLFGLAVARAGLAVANAVILGCSISLGSLVPLAMQGAGATDTSSVLRVVAANLLLLGGVLLCALAGYWRDRRATAEGEGATIRGGGLGIRGGGLGLCFFSGILTPLINVALAAGTSITEQAREAGAAASQAANAVWGLSVSAGSIPSLVYCLALLARNRSWQGGASGAGPINAGLCLGMGAIFMTSTIGYGAGATQMGGWGPVIGWPVYVSSLLIGNSVWGWLTREWAGATPRAVRAMLAGIGLQVVGILVLFLLAPK